jgi:hypothetical protein
MAEDGTIKFCHNPANNEHDSVRVYGFWSRFSRIRKPATGVAYRAISDFVLTSISVAK